MQSQALTMWVDAHVLVGKPSPVANIIYQCLRETVKLINMFLLIFQQTHQNVNMLIFLISATEISDSAMVLDSAHFKSSPRSCSTGSRPAGRCPSLSLSPRRKMERFLRGHLGNGTSSPRFGFESCCVKCGAPSKLEVDVFEHISYIILLYPSIPPITAHKT